jgi:hypothetical protein
VPNPKGVKAVFAVVEHLSRPSVSEYSFGVKKKFFELVFGTTANHYMLWFSYQTTTKKEEL